MYYRVTRVSHKAGLRDKMTDYLNSQKDLMGTIEGLHGVKLIGISDTEVFAISEYDNEQQVANAEQKFGQIMGGLKDYFTAAPSVVHGEAFWSFEN